MREPEPPPAPPARQGPLAGAGGRCSGVQPAGEGAGSIAHAPTKPALSRLRQCPQPGPFCPPQLHRAGEKGGGCSPRRAGSHAQGMLQQEQWLPGHPDIPAAAGPAAPGSQHPPGAGTGCVPPRRTHPAPDHGASRPGWERGPRGLCLFPAVGRRMRGRGVPGYVAPGCSWVLLLSLTRAETLSRDFTAAPGRMSHPGR